MCNNEACFRYSEGYFQYCYPTYGPARPRAKRLKRAKLGWISVKNEQVLRRRAQVRRLESRASQRTQAPQFKFASPPYGSISAILGVRKRARSKS
jgi:hypothetical protein